MSWLSDLLTGEGPSLETRSLSTVSEEQRTQLNALLTQLGGRGKANPNDMVAQLTQPERTSLAALEQRSLALAQPDTTGQAARGSVEKLLDFEGQTADAGAYFESNVQNPMLEQFGSQILPQISRQFGGNDFFSSERQATEGDARNDLLKALTAGRTSVELDQFNQSRNRALTAAGLVPQLNQADAVRTGEQTQILEALGLPRNIEQAGLDKAHAEDKRTEELLAQLSLTPTIENIGMTDPGNAGILNILMGGAAGGLGDILGSEGGKYLKDLWGSLFGGEEENPSGQGPSDADGMPSGTGGSSTPIPVPAGGVGGTTTPGGNVTITEPSGQSAQQPNTAPNTGINLGPMTGGVGGAIAGQVGAGLIGGGSAIITEAGGQLAAQVGAGAATAGGAGAAGAGAAGAGGAAGTAGGSVVSGAATALTIAGAIYAGYGAYEAAAVGDKKNAAMSGAAAGAAIGSIVPVVGTAVGAVIGAVVGIIGASLGNKENPSELAYGSYKKLPTEVTTRNWTTEQIGGAMFESIKSHTKSGNVNRFKDVGEMYTAFGITKDAHKNTKNVQNQMNIFIEGVIQTAQAVGGLPKDPAELAKLDGQQIYEKIVKPAMAAKVGEATGQDPTTSAWSPTYKGETAGTMHNLFADYTDWITSHWGQDHSKVNKQQERPATTPRRNPNSRPV